MMKKNLALLGLVGVGFTLPAQAGSLEELKKLFNQENVEIDLALTGDYLYTANRNDIENSTSFNSDKFGYNAYFGIELKPTVNNPLGFRFTVSNGAWAPTVGYGTSQNGTAYIDSIPSADEKITIDEAYVVWVAGPLTIQGGRILTNIGGEAPYTWQNINIQRGLVWAGEPVFYNGLRISFTANPFNMYIGVNDRDTDDGKFAVEAGFSGSWKALNMDWSFNVLFPDHSDEDNKRVFNITTNWHAFKNLPITFYVDYLNVPVSGSKSRNAFGFALLTEWKATDKISLGARVEKVIQESKVDAYNIGEGNDAWTFTITPKYQFNKYFYIKAETSFVKTDKDRYVRKIYNNGSQSLTSEEIRAGAEIGFVF